MLVSTSVITAQPFAVRFVFVPASKAAHASPMHLASCSAGFEDANVSRIAGVSRTLFVLKQPVSARQPVAMMASRFIAAFTAALPSTGERDLRVPVAQRREGL